MLIRTGKQRIFATLFVCGIFLWGAVSAFVELRNPTGGADRWRIDHVSTAGTGANEEAFQIIDIDGGTDPRLNLYLDNGRLGVSQYCALDGTSCSTAAAIATAIAGVGTATTIQASSTAPGSPNEGDIYYDTDDNAPYVWNGTAWEAVFDDLGDHTATQTLNVGGQNIDGTNFDVIGASGNTTIGGTLNVGSSIQAGADGTDGSLIIYSEQGGTDYTYTVQPNAAATQNVVLTLPVDDGDVGQILQTDGGGALSWVDQAGADDLGDHTATTTLNMGTQNIDGTNFDVIGASGNTTIGGTLGVGGDTTITDGIFSVTEDSATTASVVDVVSVNASSSGTVANNFGIGLTFDGEDLGGIEEQGSIDLVITDVTDDAEDSQFVVSVQEAGTITPELTISGGGITLSSGATVNNIETTLTDDDTRIPTSGAIVDYVGANGDNLGDHTATTTLNVGSQNIDGTNFDVIGASGNTTIGGTLTVLDGATSLTEDSATTAAVVDVLSVNASTSGTVANNFGVGLTFDAEDLGGIQEQGSIDLVVTDVTDGAETSEFVFSVQEAGAITPEVTISGGGLALATGSAVNEIETTITDDDTHLPTSGAVVDYVAGQISGLAANTLDGAYDEGGAGAGRTITVDSGAFQLIGSNAADETLEVSRDTTVNNSIVDVAVIGVSTSDVGNGVSGLGTGLVFEVENDAGEIEERASIDVGVTDVTDGAEDGQFLFRVQEAGTIGTEFTISGDGISLATGATVNNIETTITDSDTRIPTSGAVVDYVAANGDDLGDHTATQTLNVGGQNIDGTNFDVIGASGNTTIGGTLNVGSSIQAGADGTDGSLIIYSEQGGTDYTYTVQPNAAATQNVVLTLPVDDGDVGQILQTDGGGALSWVDQAGADDLGNHTATTDLNMAGNWIGGDATGTEGIFVDTDGEVGIGTNTPSVALEVSGQVLASGTITSSDVRLKENIQPIENSLEKLLQVNTYTYTWKDKQRGEGIQFGVLAQEMEAIYPDVVHTFEDGYKAVNYQALVAPLIDAVQELSDRVEALEAENAALQEALQP